MADAPTYDLVYLANRCDFIPVVTHDPQGRQLNSLVAQRSVLDLVIPLEAVIKVGLFKVDSGIIYQQIRNPDDQTCPCHRVFKV